MRYFLLKFFNVATPDDDPDKFRSEQKAASTAEEKAVTNEIINSFDAKVKEFLAANPKESDNVKKLVEKYVKGGNYFAIEESTLAAKLLQDFKDTFVKED